MNSKSKERQMAELLIGYFEQFPCLYADKSSDYFDKNKRTEAFKKIWIEMQKHDPTIKSQQIETRIRSLRTQYGRELRYQRNKIHYEPKLWCFPQLSFLKPHIKRQRTLESDETYEDDRKRFKIYREKPQDSNNVKSGKRSRKLGRTWSKEETDHLVDEIRNREILWNPETKGHNDKNLRNEIWDEVAKAVGIPREHIYDKWNNLRKSFRAMYKKRHSKLMDGEEITHSDSYILLSFLGNTVHLEDESNEIAMHSEAESTPNSPEHKIESIDIEEYNEDEISCLRENYESLVEEDGPFEIVYPDEDQSDSYNEDSMKSAEVYEPEEDMWQSVANFVAAHGREWQKKHPMLANEFRTTIYQALVDFQTKVSIEETMET